MAPVRIWNSLTPESFFEHCWVSFFVVGKTQILCASQFPTRTCIKLIIKCFTSGLVFISEFIFSLAFLQSSRSWDVFFVVCSCRLYWFVRALAYIRSMVRLFVSFTFVILRLVSVPSVELFFHVPLFRVFYRSVVSFCLIFLCRLQPKATSNLYVDVRRRGTCFKELFPEGSPGGN